MSRPERVTCLKCQGSGTVPRGSNQTEAALLAALARIYDCFSTTRTLSEEQDFVASRAFSDLLQEASAAIRQAKGETTPTLYGQTVYFDGGKTAEISTPHSEWTADLAHIIETQATLLTALEDLKAAALLMDGRLRELEPPTPELGGSYVMLLRGIDNARTAIRRAKRETT